MELAALGSDHKALRTLAKNLIEIAKGQSKDALVAIREIADRLDGKPAQEIEHSGEVETTYVARIPPAIEQTEAWASQHVPHLKQ